MSLMSDFQSFEKKLVARIKELQAHVTELEELRGLAKRLGVNADVGSSSTRRTRRATGGRARRGAAAGAAASSTATARRSRAGATPRRTGTASGANGRRASGRRDAVLAAIQANPNIRVREVAEKLGVKDPTTLYRVVRQLESDGKITKQGPLLSAK
jgi:transposase-like protein